VSYKAEISRSSPTALLVIIDQSTSMGHQLHGGGTKAGFLADVVNKTFYTIITNCSKADGVRDYFEVGVVAYSGLDARNGFSAGLSDRMLHPISVVANQPLRVESRVKKVLGDGDTLIEQAVKFPVWFDPLCRGKTSMCAGLNAAYEVLQAWCSGHPNCFPPTVLHVTDGHPTDGDPEPIAERIKSLGTEDGACLMYNLHVDVGAGLPLMFPNDERTLPDRFAKRLFRMSSVLPPQTVAAAKSRGHQVHSGARGFVFNAGIESIADFFDIGTRPSEMVGAAVADR
jgi:hypothetical protein